MNAARRTGGYVETDKKFAGGTNQSAHSTVPNAKKLDVRPTRCEDSVKWKWKS